MNNPFIEEDAPDSFPPHTIGGCPHCGRCEATLQRGRIVFGLCASHCVRWVITESAPPIPLQQADERRAADKLLRLCPTYAVQLPALPLR